MTPGEKMHMLQRISFMGAVLILSGTAMAGPFSFNVQNDVYGTAQGGAVNGIPTANDDNDGLPDINDAANLLYGIAGLGTPFARNYQLDGLFLGDGDSIWQELGGGTVALIGLTAGNSNTIGVYTDLGVGSAQTNVLGPASGFGFTGDGSAANPFPAGFTGLSLGQSYGWFLNSSGSFYFSEPGLNSDQGIDHLMTFDMSALEGTTIYVNSGSGSTPFLLGANTFLLAWEDLPFQNGVAGDDDYDDMIYLITNAPRNAPEPTTLGLIAVGLVLGFGRRRRS
jgi:hypothetical protein